MSSTGLPLIDTAFDWSSKMRLASQLPRIATWNARGLFAADPALRRKKLLLVKRLCHDNGIVLLIETHGRMEDVEHTFNGFHSFCGLHPVCGRGGVIILVKDSLAELVTAKVTLVPGRLLLVRLSFEETHGCNLCLFGIHVEGEAHDHASKCAVLDALQEFLCSRDLCIIAGDWNAEPPHSLRTSQHCALYKHAVTVTEGFSTIAPALPSYLGSTTVRPRSLDYFRINLPMHVLEACAISVQTREFGIIDSLPRISDHLPVSLSLVLPWLVILFLLSLPLSLTTPSGRTMHSNTLIPCLLLLKALSTRFEQLSLAAVGRRAISTMRNGSYPMTLWSLTCTLLGSLIPDSLGVVLRMRERLL